MDSRIKQLILYSAVETINDIVFEKLADDIHDAVVDSMQEILGDTIDFNKDEVFDLMMDLCRRIAIVGLPE